MSNGRVAVLSHLLWIGGAPDAGKTTAARLLAKKHHLPIYHCDKRGLAHYQRLAQNDNNYRDFLAAPFEKWWVQPDSQDTLQWMLSSARDRFPLIIEELIELPRDRPVVAEGVDLLPDLVAGVIALRRQAIWLTSTEAFMAASMRRRRRLRYGRQVSDLKEAKRKIVALGVLIGGSIRAQATAHGYEVVEVSEAHSPREVLALVEQQFAPFLGPMSEEG